jgi:hypothetical protein
MPEGTRRPLAGLAERTSPLALGRVNEQCTRHGDYSPRHENQGNRHENDYKIVRTLRCRMLFFL